MLSNHNLPTVIVIIGPTAVGKTDLAIEIAKKINGEIISADSRLFYRGMDIGTAKPTKEQLAEIPHHMIDCAEPEEVWSLSIYKSRTLECIKDIFSRGKIPILVGGTGQFIRAITEGWEIPPQQPNKTVRLALEKWADQIGGMALYEKLKVLDSQAAEGIDPTNVRRTIRAIEVILLTGKKFSSQRTKTKPKFNFWVIGLNRPRSEIFERIDLRIEEMFKQGLIEETKRLLDKGVSPQNPNLSAIGYREVIHFLNKEISLEEAKTQMKKKTREFVRRQRNWFKPDDPSIHWYEMGDTTIDEILGDMRIAIKG
jgi:tRNA dimethylallyltransferase